MKTLIAILALCPALLCCERENGSIDKVVGGIETKLGSGWYQLKMDNGDVCYGSPFSGIDCHFNK